jgi:hypothetical protein
MYPTSVYNAVMADRALQELTLLILTALAAGPQHGYGIMTDATGRKVRPASGPA